MDTIRIMLVDDHALLRQGLTRLLELDEQLTVIGQAATGAAGYSYGAEKPRPDVVVLDVNLPDMTGIEVAAQIRRLCPGIRILALTIHDDASYISEMIRAGVDGYMLKDAEPARLISAIKRVGAENRFSHSPDGESGESVPQHQPGIRPNTDGCYLGGTPTHSSRARGAALHRAGDEQQADCRPAVY